MIKITWSMGDTNQFRLVVKPNTFIYVEVQRKDGAGDPTWIPAKDALTIETVLRAALLSVQGDQAVIPLGELP